MDLQRLARGALAGTLATVPMTAAMGIGKAAGWMVTPPPEQVTAEVQQEAGIRNEIDHSAFTISWLGAHVAFGAACGALYAEGRRCFPHPPVVAGMIFGTVIWAAAYGAALPALGLYPSVPDDSHTRTTVMLAAHEVFGASLGVLYAQLS
jgi:hypothetical protein